MTMSNIEKNSQIPASVLSLLAQRWRDDPRYSAFEGQFQDLERGGDPSWYHYYSSDRTGGGNCLSHAEVSSLIHDSVFEGVCRRGENTLSVNEHAQHALVDFLGEVYRAWDKFQDRVVLAEQSDRSAEFDAADDAAS